MQLKIEIMKSATFQSGKRQSLLCLSPMGLLSLIDASGKWLDPFKPNSGCSSKQIGILQIQKNLWQA